MTTDPLERTVLLVTTDRALLQRGRRIAAAARHRLIECPPARALPQWARADAVLVGIDALGELTRLDPRRRDGVYVIAGDQVPDGAWRDCVAVGAADAVVLDEAEGWLVERLSLGHGPPASGRIICVRGAAGGVGASCLTAGLALAAPDDRPVVVVETDVHAGWLDLLLGIDQDGLGWGELTGLRGRVGGEALAASVPGCDGISLVTADRDAPAPVIGPDALRSTVLAGAALGGLVLIDDGGHGPLSRTAHQLCDQLILVTTSDLRGGLAVRRAVDLARAEDDGSRGAALLVAARTRGRGALPTRAFHELVGPVDHCFWLREAAAVDRRVGRGLPGLVPGDRFVRDCADLLEWSAARQERAA
ncbi:septum site-determining protein Ssd [Blastococcus sp. Marseille-P5729]|uniref:septum site-determining protein Ssd n=1 Tax=Blastococcus sp. Marseille-P5729 TaxID=2086582 RepID=UPI000D10CFCB|nr:septum site-determining protein Ssd [Blastococcus sp. Marseille-P5729]